MKQTPNYGFPLLENGDKYTKEYQNDTFTTIDREIKAVTDKVNMLDGVEGSILETTDRVDKLENETIPDVNKKIDDNRTADLEEKKIINASLDTNETKIIKSNGINKLFAKLNNGIPAVIVCIGDSTTQGINVSPNFVDLVSNHFKVTLGYGNLVTVINAGVGGDTTIKGLNRLVTDVVNKTPDLVISCFGINDVETGRDYKESINDYRNIIKQLLTFCEKGLDIIIRTPNINRNLSKINNFVEYNKEVEKMVREFGLQFADYNLYMRQQNYTQEFMDTLTYDDIHPNTTGYKLMFDYMVNFLRQSNINKTYDYNLSYIDLNSKNVKSPIKPVSSANFYGGYYIGQGAVTTIDIKFIGNEVNTPFTKSSSAGKVKITLDDIVIENEYDLYNPTLIWQSIYTIKNLKDAEHTLKIEFLGTKNDLSTGINCFIGGLTCKSYRKNVAENYNADISSIINTSYENNIYTIVDKVSGLRYQAGFASCDKNGWVTLKYPYKASYNVVMTQSGNGGGTGNTFEAVYLSSGADMELTRFRPRWNSNDDKKGINWIAFGV